MASSKFDGRPDTYRDRDTDQERQFTYVDYSKKTKVNKHMKENVDSLIAQLDEFRQAKLKALLALPAVGAAKSHPHLILRGEGKSTLEWNVDALTQVCNNIDVLYDVYQLTWRRVIDPLHWGVELSFEEIAEGGYKKYLMNNYEHSCLY